MRAFRSNFFRMRRLPGLLLGLLALPALSGQDAHRLHVRTDLVYLSVVVADTNGKPKEGLKVDNFKIYEDGVEQSIHHFDQERVSTTIGLVLDRSGSMVEMMEDVYQAALHVIQTANPGDQFFAVSFSDNVKLEQELTGDAKEISDRVRKLKAGGTTALYDGVYRALDYIKHGQTRRKALVIVTDGDDNASSKSFKELVRDTQESEVLLYVAGMTEERMGGLQPETAQELRELAYSSGAAAHFPTDVESCRQVMRDIARELGAQYGMGYYPSNTQADGKWRRIEVRLEPRDSKLKVRTRAGYFAPKGLHTE